MFVFYFVFLFNGLLALLNRFTEAFGYFSIGLVGVLIVGNVAGKFARNKGGYREQIHEMDSGPGKAD